MSWLGRIGADGLIHALVSLVMCGILCAFLPWWAAVFATLAVGAAKELVWDLAMKKGTPSWKDFLCDLAGTATGAALAMIN